MAPSINAQSVSHRTVEVKPLAQRIETQVARHALIGTAEHVVRIEKIYSGIAGSKHLAQVFDVGTGAELYKGAVDIPGSDGTTHILLHLPRQDGVWMIYTSFVKNEYHLHAAKMLVPQLAFVEHRMLLKLPNVPEFGTTCWKRAPFLVSASSDGSKVAVYFDRFKKKEKMQPALVAVFNETLELDWAKDIVLDDPQIGMTYSMCVSRAGQVAVLRRAGALDRMDPSTYSLKSTLRLAEIGTNSVNTLVITPLGADGIVKEATLEYDDAGVIYLAGVGTATSKGKDPSGRMFVNRYGEGLAQLGEESERVKVSFEDLGNVTFSVAGNGAYCLATGHAGNTVLLLLGPGGAKVNNVLRNAIPIAIRPSGGGFDLVLAERGPNWSWKSPQVTLFGNLDGSGDLKEFGRAVQGGGPLYTRSNEYRESTLSWHLQGMLFSDVCYDPPKALDWIRLTR